MSTHVYQWISAIARGEGAADLASVQLHECERQMMRAQAEHERAIHEVERLASEVRMLRARAVRLAQISNARYPVWMDEVDFLGLTKFGQAEYVTGEAG